ncbi:MAG: hypothetical protein ACQERT_15215 [Thermodesulfobacteriota bacterium]
MATDYLPQLTRLRTDKNRTRWTDAIAHLTPHKPFLLLSILDLTTQGQIDSSGSSDWSEAKKRIRDHLK